MASVNVCHIFIARTPIGWYGCCVGVAALRKWGSSPAPPPSIVNNPFKFESFETI